MLPIVIILLGLLGPVAAWQWHEGRWLVVAEYIARTLSPQFLGAVPMVGVLLMTVGLSIMWPPGIVLVFLAAATFLVSLFVWPRHRWAFRPSPRPPETPTGPPRGHGPGERPRTRTVPGMPRGTSRPRRRSP
jgi:hypothetical protein